MASNPYVDSIEVDWKRVPDESDYPFCLAAVKGLGRLIPHPKVTYFVGENGSGKSTLLEGIAAALGLNPEGGSRNFNFATRASHSNLCDYLRIGRPPRWPEDAFFLRAESFFNVATEIERLDSDGGGRPLIDSYGGRYLHDQSHGESFLALFVHRLRGHGLYIFDEPEAALSPLRQMAVLARIHELVAQGSQFFIATHSPIILAYPDALILEISEEGVKPTDYADTNTYLVMRDFVVNPRPSVRALFRAIDAGRD